MSKARQLADLGNAYSDGALSNRNLIINGAMQVAQRGTSQTTALYKSLDRWRVTNNSLATAEYVFEQVTDAPTGFKYSFKTTVTATETMTADDRLALATIIEGQDIAKLAFGTASAKTITISFWTKASITGTYSVNIWNGDLSRGYSVGYTVSSANTWEYQTITIDGDTGGTWATDNGRGLWVVFTYSAGPDRYAASSWSDVYGNAVSGQVNMTETLNSTFQITGVQLEVGDTATPFEHRSYGQELALCQRYYHTVRPDYNNADNGFATGQCWGSGEAYLIYYYPETMRAFPTISVSAANDFTLFSGLSTFLVSGIPSSGRGLRSCELQFYSTGMTPGQAAWVRITDTTNGFMDFDAEL